MFFFLFCVSLLHIHIISISVPFRIALFLPYFPVFHSKGNWLTRKHFFQLFNTNSGIPAISQYSGDTSTGWHLISFFFLNFLFSSQSYSCIHLRFALVFFSGFLYQTRSAKSPIQVFALEDYLRMSNDKHFQILFVTLCYILFSIFIKVIVHVLPFLFFFFYLQELIRNYMPRQLVSQFRLEQTR